MRRWNQSRNSEVFSHFHGFVFKSSIQRAALENIKKVLKAAGTTLEGIVKANIFITNFEDFEALNEIYQEVRAED